MAYLKASGKEIEIMLTKSSNKKSPKIHRKLKLIADTVILLQMLGPAFRRH